MPYHADDDPGSDPDDDDEGDTVPCSHCGKPVYEDAERCPYCENYLSREDVPLRPPWWVVAGVVVCLAVVAGWVFTH